MTTLTAGPAAGLVLECYPSPANSALCLLAVQVVDEAGNLCSHVDGCKVGIEEHSAGSE